MHILCGRLESYSLYLYEVFFATVTTDIFNFTVLFYVSIFFFFNSFISIWHSLFLLLFSFLEPLNLIFTVFLSVGDFALSFPNKLVEIHWPFLPPSCLVSLHRIFFPIIWRSAASPVRGKSLSVFPGKLAFLSRQLAFHSISIIILLF